MFKIIGSDHKEYGPVSADQINAWILEGRANGQTLVQAEGTNEWKELETFAEFGGALGTKYAPPPLPGPADPATMADAVLGRKQDLNIGQCLGRAWRLLVNNPGLLLGAGLLLALIRTGLGLVPFAGPMASFVLNGVLCGGLYVMILKRARGQPGSVADMFAGFSQDFVPLMLVGIVSQMLIVIGLLACFLPGIYLAVAWEFSFVLVVDKRLEFWPAMELSRKVITRYWFQVLGLLAAVYLPVLLFAIYAGTRLSEQLFPLFTRGGPFDFGELLRVMQAGAALSLGHTLIESLVLPFACSALMYAYEDVFSTRPSPAA
jgi:hypothetical protein